MFDIISHQAQHHFIAYLDGVQVTIQNTKTDEDTVTSFSTEADAQEALRMLDAALAPGYDAKTIY